MTEFVDKTGKSKTDGNCCGVEDSSKDPDPMGNIENCYHCTNTKCGCANDLNYKEELVTKITKDVLEE